MDAQAAKQLIHQFDLRTKHNQMSIGVLATGHVVALYLGQRLPVGTKLGGVITEMGRASYLADTEGIHDFRLEQLPLLYPTFGSSDMRRPALMVRQDNGSEVLDLRFQSAQWLDQVPTPAGLPALRPLPVAEASGLALTLADEAVGITVTLYIEADTAHDTFAQYVVIKNIGSASLHLTRALSWSWDFLSDQADLITFSGAWGREAQPVRRALAPGLQGVDSMRGASGHGQQPTLVLAQPHADWQQGAALAANLIYSGDFLAQVQVDMHQNARAQLGLNDWQFDWTLTPEASFTTPQAVIALGTSGLRTVSHHFQQLYTDRLLPSVFAKQERPLVINNWEATFFDFDEETLVALAQKAAAVGIERFVLDDGWFGDGREDETTALGDWWPNEAKLGGLDHLITEIQKLGLDFGIWVEPEMVSPNSHLYHDHPDWIIRDPYHTPSLARHTYALDLGRVEVQDHLIKVLNILLDEHDIDYVKWDMNRNLTDLYTPALPAERQGELRHRYLLGLYRVLQAVTSAHPQVMFEGCAGGGGRFDAGMLAYAPQIWTSDDTDAIARLGIQRGTSFIYPPQAMSCHVSMVPNQQTGRTTPLATRAAVAEFGACGYELNLLACDEATLAQIKTEVSAYKPLRKTLQMGQLDWLAVYDGRNEYAWQKLDATTLIIDHVNVLAQPNTVMKRLKALDLPADSLWQAADGQIYPAEYLMAVGVAITKPQGDFVSQRWVFKRVK